MSLKENDIYYEHMQEIEEGAYEETTCGKPHNNGEGDESCMECQIIIKNI